MARAYYVKKNTIMYSRRVTALYFGPTSQLGKSRRRRRCVCVCVCVARIRVTMKKVVEGVAVATTVRID